MMRTVCVCEQVFKKPWPGMMMTVCVCEQVFKKPWPGMMRTVCVCEQVFKKPWPGMMRTVYGNHERFETTYFKKFPGYYTTGDGESGITLISLYVHMAPVLKTIATMS